MNPYILFILYAFLILYLYDVLFNQLYLLNEMSHFYGIRAFIP